ncbi:MAG: hypothetical protein JO102_06385 [Elusimicrobia bacterium]|nr:hypothetical protein [Elusimicrobiota bacterium]
MKRIGVTLLAAMGVLSAATAARAEFVLFYESTAAVEAGRGTPTVWTSSGATVPSQTALSAAQTALIGDGQGLFKASLARLDNDLNLAVFRKGEAVTDARLASLHASRWQSYTAFLGQPGAEAAAAAPQLATTTAGPFAVKINGQDGSSGPINLKVRLKKSKFKLEVVNTSTVPVWSVEVKLSSNPPLAYWKEGHQGRNLNDIPTPVFDYKQQAVFMPIKPGTSVSVWVEAYYIKGTDYVWTADMSSKHFSQQAKIPIHFE